MNAVESPGIPRRVESLNLCPTAFRYRELSLRRLIAASCAVNVVGGTLNTGNRQESPGIVFRKRNADAPRARIGAVRVTLSCAWSIFQKRKRLHRAGTSEVSKLSDEAPAGAH
jgi:hypothetical protein